MQLSALADEARLRILDLLLQEGELHAQEIVSPLESARSGRSRHLGQLSATGHLTEHRGSGRAARYTIDPEGLWETMQFSGRYTHGR